MRIRICLPIVLGVVSVCLPIRGADATEGPDDAMPPAKAPEDSLRAFRVKPGLRIELVAAEPLVVSPVAIDFGDDGRLWVCEMRDYPTGIDGKWTPGGVIKVVEDRDHDGRYDTATAFLEGVAFPTGVMAWRKGVLVCAAPEIIYAEDTDGDGKADLRRVLFRGFAAENFQARVNGLSYALDNWVYGANGLIGGTIRGTASGREVSLGSRDFRIEPDTGVMEPASGLTQQGRVHDDWGNQFGGNNSVLLQHYPFPDHYARRNPRVAAPAPSVYVPRYPDSARLYPASQTLARYNHPESANRVTSACSPEIYRDVFLGDGYYGNAFICEPVHNLVRREVLEPAGVTFAGRRAEDERTSEFLASTDPWCRPVQVRTGPDGALWVVDMYRFVIEHPRWISPEKLATLDVRAGADKGRIYRLVPEGRSPRSEPRLDALSTRDLAAALDSPNGTLRDTVQRVLVHRADRAAVPVLIEQARSSTRPECRAQALGALDGLGAIEPSILRDVLKDRHPGVRRQAVRLSETWLGKDDAISRDVLALADDPETTVRFQVALSLGEWDGPEAGRALGRIAVKEANNSWIRAAVLSSSARHAPDVLDAVIAASQLRRPMQGWIEPLIATLAASRDRKAIARVLATIEKAGQGAGSAPSWRIGATAQLLDSARDPSLANEPAVRPVFAAARALAGDTTAAAAERDWALRLLGRAGVDVTDLKLIAGRLDPAEPAELQLAAVRGLSAIGSRPALDAIIERWPRLGPTVRAAVLDAMLARPSGSEVIVSALEAGRIAPGEIDATHRQRMLAVETESVRGRAVKVFEALAIGPRQEVLARFAPSRTLPGDPERGKTVFAKVCASCHKLGGQGHEVGPDLAALTDTSPDALLTAILDPNRDVDARYANYNAALKDGRVLTGLVASETASAITLKRQEGQSDIVLRADLEELSASGKSLMPEGLENDLKPADLADLMAYIASGADRPKALEGNEPRLVAQGADASVRLPASSAAVYGPSLTYEATSGSLGDWRSVDDRATWTFRLDRPATFTVSMEWACADESAGNPFVIRVGRATIRGEVGGTGAGARSSYRSIFLGEATLPAGTHRLEFRAAGPVDGALLHLKAVTLTPRGEGVFPVKKP
jgi:putative membrane-bound dehydrogenase-like protein